MTRKRLFTRVLLSLVLALLLGTVQPARAEDVTVPCGMEDTVSKPSSTQTVQPASNGLLFACPIITLSPGSTHFLSVVDNDYRLVSDAIFTNESPNLLRLNSDNSITSTGQTGTACVTARKDGQTAYLIVRIIPRSDRIDLSCSFHNTQFGSYGTTELYVFSTSKFYGQAYDITWSVNNPRLLILEETSIRGYPAVRFTSTGIAGDARITCRVTMADGSTAEEYCFVHIA